MHFLLDEPNAASVLRSDSKLDQTIVGALDRVGPDMRPMRDFTDMDEINLDVAKRVWLLMHDRARLMVSKRVDNSRALIEQLLIEAQVSQQCLNASRSTLTGISNLDSWATQRKYLFV